MKHENSLTLFIFLLVASLYLYFITSISSLNFFKAYGVIISTVFFSVSLFGLFLTSFNTQRSVSRFYYFGLFVILLMVLVFYIFSVTIYSIVQYYLILAILIALFLSILDFRYIILIRGKALQECRNKTYFIKISNT